MNNLYINQIIHDDCIQVIPKLEDNSIDLTLSDIPYGISLDDWDVLHANTNSALLGSSPAQQGRVAFKKRGKPINGWCKADRNIGTEYMEWCLKWATPLFLKMKPGGSVIIFGARRTIHQAIIALEKSGFILKDMLFWKKRSAHHRAQKLSPLFLNRGLKKEAEDWDGWRLGNLAPIIEPLAWLVKPYTKTILDNILRYGVGGLNIDRKGSLQKTNELDFWFSSGETKNHEAQKPISINQYLIELVTREKDLILDCFAGSGTTCVAAAKCNRSYIGIELQEHFVNISNQRINSITL